MPAAGDVGGTVPATLSLTLGAPATFGAFTPGVAKDYTASTTANVISHRGRRGADGVSDPGHLMNGTFALPVAAARSSSQQGEPGPAPVSNDVGDDRASSSTIDAERRAADRRLRQDADVHAVNDESIAAGTVAGSSSTNSAPPPGALAARTLPPCCSATWRTIASPRPEPGRPREDAPR